MAFNLVNTTRRLIPITEPARIASSEVQRPPYALRNLATTSGAHSEIQSITLSEVILNNYKAQSINMREDVLEHMKLESLAFLQRQKTRSQMRRAIDDIMSSSMRSVVDDVFNILEPYAAKLNEVLRGTPLAVSSSEPASVSETTEYDSFRQPVTVVSAYRARFSTSRLSVVIKGTGSDVFFYFLPVQQVMGLSRIEISHKPIMLFQGKPDNGLIAWEVEEKPLTYERMERYSLLLFDHLIQETRALLQQE